MVRFQFSRLISFGLRKYYHMGVFHLPKLFKDDISVILGKFSFISKGLGNAKILVFDKLLADDKTFDS